MRKKRATGKKTKTGRKPARMGKAKALLLAAVVFAVALVMALRGCPRSRRGPHEGHYSWLDGGSVKAPTPLNEPSSVTVKYVLRRMDVPCPWNGDPA